MPGVVEWAGGETNFKEAPFTAWLQSVYAEDYTTGAKAYSWENMDESGRWELVKVIEYVSLSFPFHMTHRLFFLSSGI